MATKRKTKTKRNPPKGFRSWSAYMASIRPGAKRKAATRTTSPAKETPMASKSSRRRAAVRRIATSARAGARRAGAAVSRSGVVPFATTAAMDAGGVLAGKVLVRAIRARTPIAAGTTMAALFEIGVGVALGMVIGKRNKAWGQRLAVGAMLGPMETLVRRLNVPIASAALGEDGYILTDLGADDSELIAAYAGDEEFTALSNYVDGSGMGNFVSAGAAGPSYEFGSDEMSDASARGLM